MYRQKPIQNSPNGELSTATRNRIHLLGSTGAEWQKCQEWALDKKKKMFDSTSASSHQFSPARQYLLFLFQNAIHPLAYQH
jgi:hypothetical protein